MKILIIPKVSKKIVEEAEFKYKVSFGAIDRHIDNFIQEEQVISIQVNLTNGETKKFSLEDFAIYVEEKE